MRDNKGDKNGNATQAFLDQQKAAEADAASKSKAAESLSTIMASCDLTNGALPTGVPRTTKPADHGTHEMPANEGYRVEKSSPQSQGHSLHLLRLSFSPTAAARGIRMSKAAASEATGPACEASSKYQWDQVVPATLAATIASCTVTAKNRGPQASPC